MISKLKKYELIFWDFDGVIKDSLKIKREGFTKIFSNIDQQTKRKIQIHHDNNGGVSRFEKIPLYLEYCKITKSPKNINKYLNLFSLYIKEGVVNSKWCIGVEEYLKKYYLNQYFVLVTATPTKEIHQILKKLKINIFFKEIYGSPNNKGEIISNVIQNQKIDKTKILFLGDSKSDYLAAKENNITFFLKINKYNKKLQKEFKGYKYTEIK